MPSRILREKLVTSETLATLEPDVQDRLHRYFLAADDFGCFRVQPAVIHGLVWPLRPEMTDERILADLNAYESIDTLRYFDVDGKRYAFFVNWYEHNRKARPDAKRKTPAPPKSATGPHKPAAEPRHSSADPQQVGAPEETRAALDGKNGAELTRAAEDPQKHSADPRQDLPADQSHVSRRRRGSAERSCGSRCFCLMESRTAFEPESRFWSDRTHEP